MIFTRLFLSYIFDSGGRVQNNAFVCYQIFLLPLPLPSFLLMFLLHSCSYHFIHSAIFMPSWSLPLPLSVSSQFCSARVALVLIDPSLLTMARGRSTSTSPDAHRHRGKRDRRTSRRSRSPRRKSTGFQLKLLLRPPHWRLGTRFPSPGPPMTSTWIGNRSTN